MNKAIALGLLLTLTPALVAGGDQPTGKVIATTLAKIRKSPEAYRGIWVSFDVQFASMGKVQNPFFTQFEPSKFANFYAWSAEQRIWEKKVYEDVFPLLFIRKDNAQATKIYSAKVYSRIKLTGIIRNTFQGRPWIEVSSFEAVDEKRVSTASLSHMYRGETLIAKRAWKQAIAELSLAPSDDLPSTVMGHIHKDLATCYLRLGEAATAVTHLETAVTLMNGIDDDVRQLAAMAKVHPETFLDRTLDDSSVEDYQRPMWEAFSEGTGEENADPKPTPAKSVTPAPKPAK